MFYFWEKSITQGMDKNYPCFRSFSHGKSDPEMKREETIIRHVINLDKDFWVTNLWRQKGGVSQPT